MADASFNLQYTCDFSFQGRIWLIVIAAFLSQLKVHGQTQDSDTRKMDADPASVDQSGVPPEGFIRIPNYSPPVSAFEANDIDQLPSDVRARFDKAYAEYQDAVRDSLEHEVHQRENNALLAEAERRLSSLPHEEAEIRTAFNELPPDWRNIFQTANPAQQIWLKAVGDCSAVKVHQQLVSEASFRPLMAWWAERIYTDESLSIFVSAFQLPGESKSIVPLVIGDGSESTARQEKFLAEYLTLLQRHHDRHAEELTKAGAGQEIPPSLPGLFCRKMANHTQHAICTSIKHAFAKPEQKTGVDRIKQAINKCNEVWPQWGEYHNKNSEREMMALSLDASDAAPEPPKTTGGRFMMMWVNLAALLAIALWFGFSRLKKV